MDANMTLNVKQGDKVVAKKQLKVFGSVAADVGDVLEVDFVGYSFVKLATDNVVLTVDNHTLMEHFEKHVEKEKNDDLCLDLNVSDYDPEEILSRLQKNGTLNKLIEAMTVNSLDSKKNDECTCDECDAHEEVEENLVIDECLPNKVTKEDVLDIINESSIIVETGVFDKSTVLHCKLPNGFVITTTSACVDPENYDAEIGEDICYDKLMDKIWELEGYRLQSERYYADKHGYWLECEDTSECDGCPYTGECFGADEDEDCA